jgi:serine/threonine protein kinase
MVERLFPAAAVIAADDLAGISVGHFVIERRIGSGGMGTVFLAQDERLQRPVALKVLAPHQTADPASVQRFQNEARSAARLDHDHIARVFFYGEDQGLHYIAYEFIQGVNLRDMIRQRGRLDPAEVVHYAVQLTAALCHTSASGVVHRDIKPSNIIITPQGKAKLVDLGLARKESLEESAQLTVAGTTLGTFDYISPEQAKDPRGVDVRSDIYSLGCTLYHALTGEPPFPEGTVLQRLLDHHDKPPPDPVLKNRRVSPALSAVIRKMMASDVRKRYASAEDLLRDLVIIANALGLRDVAGERSLPAAWPGLPRGSRVQVVGWSLTAVVLTAAVTLLNLRPDVLQTFSGSTPATAATPPTRHQPEATTPHMTTLPTRVTDNSPETSITSPPDIDLNQQVLESFVGPNASTSMPDPNKLFRDDALPFSNSIVPGVGNAELEDSGKPGLPIAPIPVVDAAATTDAERNGSDTVRPSKPATTASPAERAGPFVVIGAGGNKSFDSLDAACAEIRDQPATIELHFDGRLPAPQHPLRLVGKKLVTIQAAKGRQPVLWFAPKDPVIDANQSRMIFVSGGQLSLINVDLELHLEGPNLSPTDLWALISCARPDRLRLQNVIATIINPSHQAAAIVELAAPVGEGLSKMGMMKDGMPIERSVLVVDRSVLRGECSGFRIRDAVAIQCEFEQSLFAVGEWLIQAELPVNGMSPTEPLTVSLTHNTCLMGNGLYSAQGGDDVTRRQLAVRFSSRDNLFASASNQPLLDQQLPADQVDYRKLVGWTGERNFFDNLDQFWVVHTPTGAGMQQFDFEAWCSFWGSSETVGSQNEPIVWRRLWRQRRWSEIAADDASLDRTAAVNPPRSAGTDGLDAGATLEQLPGELAEGLR